MQVQALFLIPTPRTALERTISLLFEAALILDLTGACLSYNISQLGQVLDDNVHSVTEIANECVDLHLRRENSWLHTFTAVICFVCGVICLASTTIGSALFVFGFVLYTWTVQSMAIAGILSLVVLLITLLAGIFSVVCGAVMLVSIKAQLQNNELEQEGALRPGEQQV